jgi:hypothetical protein
VTEYIYVLLNPAHMQHVKIGRTARSPEERARELSTTGVPMPFVVAYEALVSDGPSAEALIHERLSGEGHRLNPSREFFDVPLKRAIAVVDEVCRSFPAITEPSPGSDDEGGLPLPGEVALLGWEYMVGSESVLQDYVMARGCFERAIALGGDGAAYMNLADLHLWGLGTRKNPGEAIRLLKEGGEKGWLECYWALWLMFSGRALHTYSGADIPENSQDTAHPQNADVAFGWLLDAYKQIGGEIPADQLIEYLEWSRSLIGPDSQAQFYGRYSKQMLASWVLRCQRILERLKQGRAEGIGRAAVLGDDGRTISLKPLMVLNEMLPKWGIPVEPHLREVLGTCDAEDLQYAFSSLPDERAKAWIYTFSRYLPFSQIPTRDAFASAPPEAVSSAAPAAKKPGWLKRVTTGLFGN